MFLSQLLNLCSLFQNKWRIFFLTNYQSIVISIGLHKEEPSSWIELTVYIFSDSFIFLCYDFSEIYFFLLSKTDYMQIEILKSIYKLHLPCIEGIAKIWYHLFPLLKGTGIYMIMIFTPSMGEIKYILAKEIIFYIIFDDIIELFIHLREEELIIKNIGISTKFKGFTSP